MECTYGNKSHDDPLQALEELRTVMKRTVERGGKVIIPAFAVGRTQEIVYDLHQMIESGELPKIPVFVDSPLALETSKVFMNHPRYFDDETHEFMEETESDNPLWFDLLTYVDSVEQSKALKDQDEPMVIISSSGMAETGRVVHHIRNNIGDPRNTILLVSYQAPNTLGRDLADGAEQVEIWGDVFPVKAEVAQISGLSGHAGQRFLQEYAEAVKGQAQQVFLVHGEQKPAEALRENLRLAGLEKICFPYPRQSMEIGG